MVRGHLPERLKAAGRELLATTDALDLQAQGAMWLYDHALQDWRFYLVTSLVDTIGRRQTYLLLLDAFEQLDLPDELTVEDVHLGSPSDDVFRLASSAVRGENGGQAEFQDCSINGMRLDGVIYRGVLGMPSKRQAERIEKRFARRVRGLPEARRKSARVHA